MYLEYLGHRTFTTDDGKSYDRECFVCPSNGVVHAIDTDIKQSGDYIISDWDYKKGGTLKIKKIFMC